MLPNRTLMPFRQTIESHTGDSVSSNVSRSLPRLPDAYAFVPLIGGVSNGPKDTFAFTTISSSPPENRQT